MALEEIAPLWEPTPEEVEGAALTRFAEWLASERGVDLSGYHELWQWSVEEPEAFWGALWDYFEVISDAPYERVLGRREMPGAEWFPGTRLNYAEHVFRDHEDAEVALVHSSELRELTETTWGELRADVARVAAGLRELGVGEGDRVVAYLPNVAEAVVGFLATASLGGVWSSASPDFGADSVVDRFAQIEPKVLIACDGYRYGGKDFDRLATVAGLRERMPSLEHTVLLGYLGVEGELEGAIAWEDLGPAAGAELRFTRVPFESPLWVLYSSGTTGLPKAIVQSQGGILIEHLKKLRLHFDLGEGDRLFWFTTTGWMMWNLLVSGLLTKAPIVLFDGNPGYPNLGALWDLAERAGITVFGTSAAYIASCMKAGIEPGAEFDLSRVRALGSTGSPLAPEGFDWLYRQLGERLWLFSTSGGTDVCTAFVGGVPTLPVYRGELQAPALGAALASWDEDGEPLPAGEVGELVLTEPMPSMPVFFWGDEDGSRYREAYYEMFPGVWRHGDWIEITEHGGGIIHGRSDSTINRGGIRMGTAEIYRALGEIDEVLDALVVDLPREGTDGWISLFVVLREGVELSDDLRARVAKEIRSRCSPRHVPDELTVIAEVPRTLSGKVMEVPVKRILMGADPEKVVSKGSMKDPATLDPFIALARATAT